jgi:hypothetical protein
MADGKITVQVSIVTSKMTVRKDDAVDWLYSKGTMNRKEKE